MELVIAVILGVILLIKFGSDKSAVKNTRDEYDKKQQKISEWKSVVTDRSLEQRLKNYIQNPENRFLKKSLLYMRASFLVSSLVSCFQKSVGVNQKQDGHQNITSKFRKKCA